MGIKTYQDLEEFMRLARLKKEKQSARQAAPDKKFRIRKRKLIELSDSWLFQAKKRFQAAAEETGFEKRGLEHGAIIYYTVANELRDAIQPKRSSRFLLEILKKYFKRI